MMRVDAETVFAVGLAGDRVAYLRGQGPGRAVFLDSRELVCHAEPATIRGGPKKWTADGKFHHAVEGFAVGRRSPVPLPCVHPPNEFKALITFDDGITRTLWLLASGAEVIPVHATSDEAAIALERVAGAAHARIEALIRSSLRPNTRSGTGRVPNWATTITPKENPMGMSSS